MTRLINSATLAALESDSFNIATLVQIDFSSAIPRYLALGILAQTLLVLVM